MEAEGTLVEEAVGRRIGRLLVDPVGLVGQKHGGVSVSGVPLQLDVEVGVVDKVSWFSHRIHGGWNVEEENRLTW
ncbi:hypothetical protein QG37_07920 [Candidozyma auris]|nr:hypothetical protein QG37_07920 [[Candida] auris]